MVPSSLVQIQKEELNSGPGYSSVTSIAISGQLVCASHALSSRPAGTEPSPTSCALPNSSSSNNSGASDLQRAWPWHLSWSTRIFSLDIASVPFLACAVGRALLPNYCSAGLWTASHVISYYIRAPIALSSEKL